MEAYLASLRYTTASGLVFIPSLPNLFLILVFLICTMLMIFCGVLLGKVNICMYVGIFMAYLSLQNLLPIFTGAAMWIPLLVLPGAFSAIIAYLILTFILWLIDSSGDELSDEAMRVFGVIYASAGGILIGLFLYIFLTHSFIIIILVSGSLIALGIINENRLVKNRHRFKTYNDLYDLRVEGYTMKVKKKEKKHPAYQTAQDVQITGSGESKTRKRDQERKKAKEAERKKAAKAQAAAEPAENNKKKDKPIRPKRVKRGRLRWGKEDKRAGS